MDTDTANLWSSVCGEAIKLLISPAVIQRQLTRETPHPQGPVSETTEQGREVEGASGVVSGAN